ncbi:MAG TPA: hypothetical protein VII72_18920 [Myxococcota bacterium]|jgi:hypothetical protein
MKQDKKRAIRVNLARVDEKLTEKLGRELAAEPQGDASSATGWSDPYRASGMKHTTVPAAPNRS